MKSIMGVARKTIKESLSVRKKAVLDYLERNRLMTLGTVSGKRPWGATVFFAYTKDGEILFYSNPKTKHVVHLKKNSAVSVVINQDHGKSGLVKGMQIVGRAKEISDKEYKKYYSIYKRRFSWVSEFEKDHRLYKITPTEIHYIDQERFGHFYRVRMDK